MMFADVQQFAVFTVSECSVQTRVAVAEFETTNPRFWVFHSEECNEKMVRRTDPYLVICQKVENGF